MVKSYSKQRFIVVSLALVALLSISAGMWFQRLDGSPLAPSFQFLADNELKMQFNGSADKTWDNRTRYSYSSSGDFDEISSKVRGELLPLGFTAYHQTKQDTTRRCIFHLGGSPPGGYTEVRINELNSHVSVVVAYADRKPIWSKVASGLLKRIR